MEKLEILEKTVASLLSEITSLKESVASGFKKVESNFENLSKKVDDLSSGTTHSLGRVDVKLDSLSDEIKKIGAVTRYESEYENLSSIEKRAN
jgi:archaellum component FlaC